MSFLWAQRDFLEFVSLFAFVLCAFESLVLNREERGRRWSAYFSFFIIQSLASAWLIVAPVLSAGPLSPLVAPLLQSVAFGSLLAFSTPADRPRGGSLRRILAWAVVLVLVDVGCALHGPHVLAAVVGMLFCVPGTIFALRFFLSDPSISTEGRPWLVAHGWSLLALGVVTLGRSVAAAAFPGLSPDPSSVPQPLLALALAVTLTVHGWRSFVRVNHGYGRPFTRFAIYASYCALPLVLLFGGILTEGLGQRSLRELRTSYSKDAEDISTKISAQTGEIDRDVAIIASSPRAGPFILSRGTARNTGLVEFLDRVSDQVHANCFIFDREGRPLAASRNASDSYLTISRSNAPAIADALAGEYGRYFMVNAHTHAREYYSSAPISDPVQGIVGVAVVEQNIESIFPEVDPGAVAFLVDEHGVILFSNTVNLDYRALWPIPAGEEVAARADGRYGYVSLVPVLDRKPSDGEVISWDGVPRMANRSYLYVPGWSIIHLGSVGEMLFYRLAGLLGTLVVALLVVSFSASSKISLLDEGRVERSESMFRAVVEGTPSWISTVEEGGRFLYINAAGRRGFGIGDTAEPETIHWLLGPENQALIAGRVETALRGSIVSSEDVLPTATGDVKVWRITLVPLKGASDGRSVILIGDDITEMRRTEARLLRAERLAAVGTLAAGVAHQFNNINAVALGYIQVLESDPGLSAKAMQYLRSIRGALERSVAITARLLPLAAAETGLESLPLAGAVRAALPSLQPDFDREKATVELSLDDTARVLINPGQLDFMVVTLLVNACHAVIGQPARSIRVSTGVADGQAFLSVRDSGIGIAPDKLSSIFTPFFTDKGEHAAPKSPMARVQGVGLSLSVVNSIVAARDGRIEIESTPGGGSTFTVWMPRA